MKNLILIGFLCCGAINSYAMGNFPVDMQQSALVGVQAPELTLPRVVGEAINFTQAREGKKAILVFWATWCPHCREEIEHLNQLKLDLMAKNIQVLFVNEGETLEEVAAYFKSNNYQMNSFLDEENALQDMYHLVGLPTVVFIDESGIVKYVANQFPRDFEDKFK